MWCIKYKVEICFIGFPRCENMSSSVYDGLPDGGE